MRKTTKVAVISAIMTVLSASSVFAAETPAGIVANHNAGMQTLQQINQSGATLNDALKVATQKDYERGMAELRRAHNNQAECGIEQQAKAGFENGQKYLGWIKQKTADAAKARDTQAQEGYDKGVAYLRQCGWQF